ncbi:MAG: putative holin-like toxin [Furfurilactobacillus sp.]|jgi:hypothetical protein|uniref:Holin-like toxin n=1 Tax=Furfurilactobacillus milii TaxID=2888272 RepID=A0ABT6D9W5_9LACO|nr:MULTISPECIES: putative holin-like toxin [Furfurilactobacillus]QLE67302.1 hypothetical protein LROSL2_1952 [Furfurilactobacillus rossiae]MCF6161008.1 putative holin-like toxin [Furfurilactobacillus milii]MCF6163502.1 putative holin-like toxin [Furfurilactobacillus milii]MCF6418697.1 putative holin-like toxin [Furfurilactobacillus milii]MCH4011492.1 putative holin-like toxin [Furfurilactobacillus sp.]
MADIAYEILLGRKTVMHQKDTLTLMLAAATFVVLLIGLIIQIIALLM